MSRGVISRSCGLRSRGLLPPSPHPVAAATVNAPASAPCRFATSAPLWSSAMGRAPAAEPPPRPTPAEGSAVLDITK